MNNETAIYHATELTKQAQLSLAAIKSANLVERVGVMEKELAEMESKIKRLEGRTYNYVVYMEEKEDGKAETKI